MLDLQSYKRLFHTHCRIGGTDSIVGYPVWTCSCADLCGNVVSTNTKVRKLIEVGFIGSLISLAFLAFASIMSTVVNYYLHSAASFCTVVILCSIPSRSSRWHFNPNCSTIFGLHFPVTSAIVHVCCKRKSPASQHVYRVRQSEETTVHKSSNWTLINQPSRTTWNPTHEDTESTPFAIDKQRQDYEAMLNGE